MKLSERLCADNVDVGEVMGQLIEIHGAEVFQNIIDKIKKICIAMFSSKDIEYAIATFEQLRSHLMMEEEQCMKICGESLNRAVQIHTTSHGQHPKILSSEPPFLLNKEQQ